jgi:hypothetical protein
LIVLDAPLIEQINSRYHRLGYTLNGGPSQRCIVEDESERIARDPEPRFAPASAGQPNTIVVADGTRRLLGNLFELEDLGAKDLKGIVGPAHAWAALRMAHYRVSSR